MYYANKWYEDIKEWLNLKIKNAKDIMVSTPFFDRDGTSIQFEISPTLSQVDSFTEFNLFDIKIIQEAYSVCFCVLGRMTSSLQSD